jgi:acetyl esterase/lipase
LGILLLASALSGCSNLEYLNFTVSHRGYVPTRNLAYGADARQKLDVFVPQSVKPNGKVVVFFYGGGWRTGSKADYRFVAQALTSHGFITVLPDYRLFPQVTFPAFVEDGAAAVRWTRDNIAKFGGDTNQIYLFGHSVGAHTAMLLTLDEHYLKAVGLEPKLIRATIGISGPYDSQPSPRDRPIFGRATNDPTFLPQIEPIKFASSNTPPMLLAHGLSDKIVSPTNTINFVTQLRQRGNDVEYIGYTNCGHGSVIICIAWPNQWIVPVFHDVTDYLDRH